MFALHFAEIESRPLFPIWIGASQPPFTASSANDDLWLAAGWESGYRLPMARGECGRSVYLPVV